MNTMSDVETFIPYNIHKDYILVNFVELLKTEQSMFNDTMVVEYKGKEYNLYWDEYNFYYSGLVADIEGFIL